MEREGKRTGSTINVTAFQATGGLSQMGATATDAGGAQTTTSRVAKQTSKSPARGGAGGISPDKRQQQQSMIQH